ncbi:MAG: efflux transporter periplasmic adaptor subunit [Rheinheimera sp.]|uniref:efflux RND transporter periplasmic adaptor subunit n=1 Tax=Arsukibacterium sp. UBA3155 TaxID=1946058 RepID=UPI000C8FCD80|nr:efflux RND transporter periplasmic adaptor subunit [Arsukibacterium sp. UBA3155]MAD76609.1 efflux transporter periplasmic adaptor subunit [Rheinheimera sp.]|tara:strand:+ start:25899 stop:27035 length:1137 start_codon:yes stop_codon:yes gene_type:complete
MQFLKLSVKPLTVLVTTSVLMLAACSEPPAAAQGQPTPEVAVVTLSTSSVALTTELPGRTTNFRQAEIRPQVSGILQQRLFTEGQQVSAGQVLYKIDPATYQAAFSSAEAALSSARAAQHNARLRTDRIKGLLGGKVVSQQDFDDANASLMQADAAVASAEAAVLTAQINLNYTDIKAPISGQIGRSLVSEGALLIANQAQGLATIRQLHPIYVDLSQSSTELLKLKRQTGADATAEVNVDLLLEDGSRYSQQGSLQFSEVNVDPGTGMVTLRAVFPNEQGQLLPGMFVRARLHHGTNDNALLVPQQAISRTPKGDATVMLVSSDNTVEVRPVTLGASYGQNWLVTDGLTAGERVIVAGLQKVRPGVTVKAVNAADGA